MEENYRENGIFTCITLDDLIGKNQDFRPTQLEKDNYPNKGATVSREG